MSILVLCGMGFQPGWANGWGVSKHLVFAAFVTGMVAVTATSFSVAVLLPIGYLAQVLTRKPFVGWLSFAALLAIALVVVLTVCPRVYQAVHAEIVCAWP